MNTCKLLLKCAKFKKLICLLFIWIMNSMIFLQVFCIFFWFNFSRIGQYCTKQCYQIIGSIIFQMMIYGSSILRRIINRTFGDGRSMTISIGKDPAMQWCVQCHLSVRLLVHYSIHALILPYWRDNTKPVYFHRYAFDFGKFECK